MKRRSLLAAAGSAAGAVLLDPFGGLGARAVQAPDVAGTPDRSRGSDAKVARHWCALGRESWSLETERSGG